jgi:hypothetical protein
MSQAAQDSSSTLYSENVVFCDVNLVALVRTDVSEESIASIIRVRRIGELGTAYAVTNNPIGSWQSRCDPSSNPGHVRLAVNKDAQE